MMKSNSLLEARSIAPPRTIQFRAYRAVPRADRHSSALNLRNQQGRGRGRRRVKKRWRGGGRGRERSRGRKRKRFFEAPSPPRCYNRANAHVLKWKGAPKDLSPSLCLSLRHALLLSSFLSLSLYWNMFWHEHGMVLCHTTSLPAWVPVLVPRTLIVRYRSFKVFCEYLSTQKSTPFKLNVMCLNQIKVGKQTDNHNWILILHKQILFIRYK